LFFESINKKKSKLKTHTQNKIPVARIGVTQDATKGRLKPRRAGERCFRLFPQNSPLAC